MDLTHKLAEQIVKQKLVVIIRGVEKKYLKDLGETNIENWEELIDVLHMISQGILDIFSDIYTESYKEDIRNYSYKHPQAKNAGNLGDGLSVKGQRYCEKSPDGNRRKCCYGCKLFIL